MDIYGLSLRNEIMMPICLYCFRPVGSSRRECRQHTTFMEYEHLDYASCCPTSIPGQLQNDALVPLMWFGLVGVRRSCSTPQNAKLILLIKRNGYDSRPYGQPRPTLRLSFAVAPASLTLGRIHEKELS